MHANPEPAPASSQPQEKPPTQIALVERQTTALEQQLQPAIALAAAVLGAALFASASLLLLEGDRLRHYLVYNVPIAVPFVLFLFERARYYLRTQSRAASVALDSVVVATALARAVFLLPLISGHALFLSYALMTMRSRLAKLAAVLVLLIVIYFKAFVWHDPSLLGGAAVGIAAGLAWKRLNR